MVSSVTKIDEPVLAFNVQRFVRPSLPGFPFTSLLAKWPKKKKLDDAQAERRMSDWSFSSGSASDQRGTREGSGRDQGREGTEQRRTRD
jgi:hypothetical protein